MGKFDDRRVGPRTVLVGMGMGTTPERIAELEQRAQQLEKLTRPKPTQAFSQVLAKTRGDAPPEPPSAKEQKHAALPKKGPRPALAHPGQREAYGREASADEAVVLKG